MATDISEQLRAEVARRADHCCEYCRIREDDGGFLTKSTTSSAANTAVRPLSTIWPLPVLYAIATKEVMSPQFTPVPGRLCDCSILAATDGTIISESREIILNP